MFFFLFSGNNTLGLLYFSQGSFGKQNNEKKELYLSIDI